MALAPLHVVSLGASTALGRDASSSAAAVHAGIAGFGEHPYMIDSMGEPMRAAIVPWLEIDCQGNDRLEALLVPAVEQALGPVIEKGTQLKVALALALPPARPGQSDDLGASIRERVIKRFGPTLSAIAMFPVGHAGGFLGLEAAWRSVDAASFDACVIAGVDSYLEPKTLNWLEGNDQLHGAGPLNNAWGFVPGEGAGAVLVVGDRAVHRWRLDPLATVLSVGNAIEQKRIKTKTVCIGEGLTEAVRSGIAGLSDGAQVTDVYCDMNGEPYRADEYGFAALRLKEHFVSASDFVAPADCWGDVSAASVPLQVMLAIIAASKGYASGPWGLVWASSESGERGAALLRTVVQEVP